MIIRDSQHEKVRPACPADITPSRMPGTENRTGRILALPPRGSTPSRSAQELIPLGLRFCRYIHVGVQKPGHSRKRVYSDRHSNQRNKQVVQLKCESAIPQKEEESENKKWIKFRSVTL